MSWWDKDGEGSDDENEDGNEGDFNTVNDRIIFLIDGRAPMAERNSNGETHLQNSLSIVLAVMKSKIIASGESSSIGLSFFGTKDRDAGAEDGVSSTNGVLTLFSLSCPSAQRIRQLQNLIENPEELSQLVQPHPQTATHPNACPLKQALWTCSQSFGSNDYKKSDMKRIWIFTNDDNPNAQNTVEQTATLTVARDCAQAGIEVSLWHLDPPNNTFDPEIFYMKLLRATSSIVITTNSQSVGVIDADEVDDAVQSRIIGAGREGFDPNMAGLRRKEHKKRRLGSVLFSLTCPSQCNSSNNNTTGTTTGTSSTTTATTTPHLAVAMYKSIHIAKKPNHTWLYARTNEPIKVVSKYYDTSTGETLTSEQIKTYLEVGAATIETGTAGRISFDTDELKYIKTVGNNSGVGLQLLYFMPITELRKDLNVESSYFLFPDDKSVKGSSLLFEGLLRDLAAKNLVGVVRFNRTDSAQPRLAALLPQLEVVDPDEGSQLAPAGFYLIQLPFAEDVRCNPAPHVAATAENTLNTLYNNTIQDDNGSLVQVAQRLVQALTLPGDFSYTQDIQSPAVQQYYSILQALALNQDEPEWSAETDDTMRPDSELLERCHTDLAQFKALAGLSDDMLHVPKKRSAPGEAAAGGGKKTKTTATTSGRGGAAAAGEGGIEVDGVGALTEGEIAAWAQSGQLMGMTAVQLKSMCKGLGLPVSGPKADLVARITAKFP